MEITYTLEDKYSLIREALLHQTSCSPLKIVRSVMHEGFISIHGPEHHFLDGGAFLTACYNAGLDFDLEAALKEFAARSMKMPGAMCGHWGVCGSVTSIGAALSILDYTGPISSDRSYGDHMEFTSKVIAKMGKIGGPRCCKRNAFLSIKEAIVYAKEHYGIALEDEEIICEFSFLNKQCIKERCPFHKK